MLIRHKAVEWLASLICPLRPRANGSEGKLSSVSALDSELVIIARSSEAYELRITSAARS